MRDDARTPGSRSGDEPDRPRRPRARELWETEVEPFTGALVLWDLEDAAPDDAATILARFATLRCLGAVHPTRRQISQRDRAGALTYVNAAPEIAAGPLQTLLRQPRPRPAVLYRALVAASLHAARRHHAGGAYSFLRWAYELARAAGKAMPAATAAARLAGVARRDGAPYAARRWAARAHALRAGRDVSGARTGSYVAGMDRPELPKGGGYDAAARRALSERIAGNQPLVCPVCGAPLSLTNVPAPGAVSYVRRRVWVLCTGCRRTAALDVPGKQTD